MSLSGIRPLPPGMGLAYVDAATPQLGIALLERFRGRGFGEQLMRAALAAAGAAGHRQVALTVHPQNPAVRMYERCGFERREIRNGYDLMVATSIDHGHMSTRGARDS
jgi:GNAT superfamily N-acetyltransferase